MAAFAGAAAASAAPAMRAAARIRKERRGERDMVMVAPDRGPNGVPGMGWPFGPTIKGRSGGPDAPAGPRQPCQTMGCDENTPGRKNRGAYKYLEGDFNADTGLCEDRDHASGKRDVPGPPRFRGRPLGGPDRDPSQSDLGRVGRSRGDQVLWSLP